MESLNQVLIDCVKAAGGSAVVGAKIFPEKTPQSAQRTLLDCLSEDRPAKLSPEQVLLVLRLARAKGYHEGMNFIAADLGYGTPVPIEPRDEVADLMREFNASVEKQAALADKIQKAASRLSMRAVA
jgi:hypothetical protein